MKVSMQWVVPVIMGAWAVLTWAHNNDQERRKERSRLSAQYVNPFMSACEDLQSRIYWVDSTVYASVTRTALMPKRHSISWFVFLAGRPL